MGSAIDWRRIEIKSLYTRVVLIFIGVVAISLFLAFFLSTLLFQSRMHAAIETVLMENAQKIVTNYQTTPSKNLPSYLQNFAGFSSTIVQVYDPQGRPLLADSSLHIDHDDLHRVLAGERVHEVKRAFDQFPAVGMPMPINGTRYALFLSATPTIVDEEMNREMYAVYVIVLLLGSLFILLASRYLVKPLLQMTEATRRLARGTFEIELPTKRKDEIGTLAASINEMARELAKVERTRQEFVSNVSHEIQSPLTSIIGFAKALRKKKMSAESQQYYLQIIESESERLSRMSRNLLRLSSLQQGKSPLHISTFALDEQLRKVVIGLEPQWDAKDIEMVFFLDPITITADEDQLNQVWINLLSNSIKFTPVGGKIVIESKKKQDAIHTSVSDTGPGIPEEERADIFKPFHKVDKSRDPSVQGNGLGLSIVKQIVELHHGEIEVAGRPEQGSVFLVTLPNR